MNHLNPAQAEQLKEIGAHLRQLRQEQSIPLEEVAAKTFIRLPLLKALEEGQSDHLPEPVFIQGFIRRYGDALGMDGTALAKTFPISFMLVEPETSSQDLPKPRDRSSIPLYVPGIVLLLAAVSGLLYLVNRPRTVEPVVQKQSPPVAQQQKPIAKPVPSLAATPTPARAKPKPSPSSVPIQVSVNITDRSWVRVIADGTTQFQGILTKGNQKTWKAKKQLTLRTGNAGGVSVSVNRGEPKPLGALGAVEQVTFTSDNQNVPKRS